MAPPPSDDEGERAPPELPIDRYDDLAGVDLKGKVALVLDNAPNSPDLPTLFGAIQLLAKDHDAAAKPLREAEADEVAALNARIEAGEVTNVGGEKVEGALDGGLVRDPSGFAGTLRRALMTAVWSVTGFIGMAIALMIPLQLIFGVVVLSPMLQEVFKTVVDQGVNTLIGFADEGAKFVFASFVPHSIIGPSGEPVPMDGLSFPLVNMAFAVLPTIVFFSSLMSVLYHIGVMQKLVYAVAWVMQRTMGTSGAESLSAAANIFVGQTEAPLVIGPFVKDMTKSELHAVMTGGFLSSMVSGYLALILLVLFALVGVVLSQAGILFPSSPAATSSSAKASTTSAAPTSKTPSPTSSSPTPTESTPAAINLIPEEYLGQPYNEVRSKLIGLGLGVTGKEVADDSAPGTVTNIDPAGTVQPGTTITVSYSKGPDKVTVPSLEPGASEKQVQRAIENAGLRWQKGAPVEGDGTQDEGTFVSSEPGSGEQVPAGSVVTYHLATAPAPASDSPSPSATTTK